MGRDVAVGLSTELGTLSSKVIQVVHLTVLDTVFPRFSAPGRLPIFEVFGGVLTRAGALIKTDENVDSELLGQEKEKMDWLYLVYIVDVHPGTKLQKH